MSSNFPSRDELSSRSLDWVKSQIPYDKDDEDLMQEIVDSKQKLVKSQSKVYKQDIHKEIDDLVFSLTPEKEKELQKKIDKREAAQAKKEGREYKPVVEEPVEPEVAVPDPVEAKFPGAWCELCGSKGVRHKLGCPTLTK